MHLVNEVPKSPSSRVLVRTVLALASPAQPKSPRAKAKRKTPKPQPQRPKPLQPKPLQPKSLLRAEVELSFLFVDGYRKYRDMKGPVSQVMDRMVYHV